MSTEELLLEIQILREENEKLKKQLFENFTYFLLCDIFN